MIFQAPEIETADAVGLKLFCEFDAAAKHIVLLGKAEVRVKLVALRAEFGCRRAGPIHFEERAGDIGNAQFILCQDALRFGDFLGVQIENVFIPHSTKLDPRHSKFPGDDFAHPAKILADFVIDHRETEWRCDRETGAKRRSRTQQRQCQASHPRSFQKFAARKSRRHGKYLHSAEARKLASAALR